MVRPRTTTPPDEELIPLGEELLKWATEPTEELRYHLNQWYGLVQGISKSDFELLKDKPVFHPYYEFAKIALAKRYVDGSINQSIAHRFIRLYFPEVQDSEDALLRLKAELAIKEKALDQDIIVKGVRECLREFKEGSDQGAARFPDAYGSQLEIAQSLLDKGCVRESCEVPAELGSEEYHPDTP